MFPRSAVSPKLVWRAELQSRDLFSSAATFHARHSIIAHQRHQESFPPKKHNAMLSQNSKSSPNYLTQFVSCRREVRSSDQTTERSLRQRRHFTHDTPRLLTKRHQESFPPKNTTLFYRKTRRVHRSISHNSYLTAARPGAPTKRPSAPSVSGGFPARLPIYGLAFVKITIALWPSFRKPPLGAMLKANIIRNI